MAGQSVTIKGNLEDAVKSGRAFVVALADAALGDDSTLVVQLTTPNNDRDVVLRLRVGCEGAATVLLAEAPTVDAAGSAATELNLKRSAARTAGVVGLTGSTFTDPGTTLLSEAFQAQHELPPVILAPNTIYAITLTNKSGAAAASSINAVWEEQ